MEQWRNIIGYEYKYQISDYGNVRSLNRMSFDNRQLKGKQMKLNKSKSGYLIIELSNENVRKTFNVHRLVAIHFLENPNNYPQVNHKDGDKSNNNYHNLEWVNNSMNIKHAIETGLNQVRTKLLGNKNAVR